MAREDSDRSRLPADGYTEGHDGDFNDIQSAFEEAAFADSALLSYVFDQLDSTYVLGQGDDFMWSKQVVLEVYQAFLDHHGHYYPADEEDRDVYDADVAHLKR